MNTSIDDVVKKGSIPVFTQEGKVLSLKQVFDSLYSGLDPLIDFNNFKLDLSKKNVDINTESYILQEEEKFLDWANNVPTNIQAQITFEGKNHTFNVNSRTDLEYTNHSDPSKRSLRVRRPNIAYLEESETGKSSILRRATFWPKTILKGKIGAFKKANRVNHEWQKAVEFKDSWGEYLNPKKIHLIPEPILRVALKNLEGSYGTIVAKGREIEFDQDNKDLYILRPFFDSITEKPLNTQRLVDYIASMHSLGLSDKEDRQIKHYCSLIDKKNIINIDPDFYVFIGKYDNILDDDRRAFIDEMSVLSPVVESKKDELYELAKSQIISRGKDDFLEAMPKNIREIKESLEYM